MEAVNQGDDDDIDVRALFIFYLFNTGSQLALLFAEHFLEQRLVFGH